MILPKLVYKLISIFLAGIVFFTYSAVVFANHQSIPVPHDQGKEQPAPTYYKIVPIPPPDGSQEVVPIPPTSAQNPQIQQAGIFGDLVGSVGDIFGLVGDLVIGGITSAFGAMVKAAVYIFEHAIIIQVVGTVANEIIDVFSYNDPQEAMARFQEIAADPASFGSIGAIGVFQGINDSIVSLSIPISTSSYFASINPFAPVSADGADALSGSYGGVLLEVWKNVRDASYALMVAALVIIGFMIMLRWKLGPRTTVTIQNALPRIAISLLLITFSFAISGLMLDLIRVSANIFNSLVDVGVSLSGVFNVLSLFIGSAAMIWVILNFTALFTGLHVAIVVIALLLLLLLAIIILIVFGIIIYKLLTRYVIFLLLTMFAPFFFLVGAIPGMEGVIYTWFKRAFAALLAIPLTGLVLRLAFVIGFSGFGPLPGATDVVGAGEGIAEGIPGFNLIGGVVGGAFAWIVAAPIIGLGLFFYATKVPDMVDELLGIGGRGGGRGGGGFGPGAIIGAPVRGFQNVGQLGRAWSGTLGMREAVGRTLARKSAVGPRPPVEAIDPHGRFRGGQPLLGLSPDRRKELEPSLRKAGAIVTDASGVERIKSGTTVEFPGEQRGGFSGLAARTAAKVVGGAVGMEKPPHKIIVRTPEMEAEEQAAEEAVPGGKSRRGP